MSEVLLEDVPQGLAEALRWDDPERQLQFHTSTRTPGGERVRPAVKRARPAIFHGHGVATADDPEDYILRYFHQVDGGMRRVLAEAREPLVLAGGDYLLPIYREANTYPHLVEEGIAGNPDQVPAEELRERAWAIVQPLFLAEREQAAAQCKRLAGAGSELIARAVGEVIPAAYVGRVETLFVTVGLQQWGNFDPGTNQVRLHREAEAGDEDLLDLAAIHTLSNGGTVYAVEPEEMPIRAPLAAVLRF